MKELVRQRATVSFALLLIVTLASFWLTVGHGGNTLSEGQASVWTLVIVLAFIKVRWVMLDFMELRSAPIKLRVLYEAWGVGVAAVLIATAWLVS
ncbi:MAG: cytochrome C oxidase subunit IV family protein [Mycobacterium sp.]